MKALIIGAQGMLGHDLVNAFTNDDVIPADLPEWDITEEKNLKLKIQNCQPDIIINSAAFTDVEGAEENKELAFKVNAEGVLNLAKICQELNIPLVHISTEMVFNGEKKTGYNEDDQTSPLSIYGQSKEQGEKNLTAHCQQYYLIRSSWLFGLAKQRGKPRGQNFIDKIIELGENQSEVRVVCNQYGKPTFTHDLARMLKQLVGKKMPYGVYHLVNEGVTTWYDLAKEVFRLKQIKTKLIPVTSQEFPSRVKRPTYAILNNNRFFQLRPWQEAVTEYLKYK